MKLFTVFILFLAFSVNAGIYKWTDSEGNVHFGDRPVNQGNATELNIDTKSRAGITHSSGNKKERELVTQELEEDRTTRKEEREKKLAEKKKKYQLCKKLKNQLLKQQRSNRSFKYDSYGERIYLTNDERAAREAKIKKAMSKNCL